MQIVSVLRPRDGMAGSAVTWGQYLIDGDDSRCDVLADGWGINIAHGNCVLKGGQVDIISNYIIPDKEIPSHVQTTSSS